MTLYKKSLELQQQLREKLAGLPPPAVGPQALHLQAALEEISDAAAALNGNIAKMKAKAQLPADKQVTLSMHGTIGFTIKVDTANVKAKAQLPADRQVTAASRLCYLSTQSRMYKYSRRSLSAIIW